MSMMHCSDADLDLFWTLATSSFHTVMTELGQKCVPKNALKKGYNYVDFLEKSLWILRLRCKFSFISPPEHDTLPRSMTLFGSCPL
jgi:hypothetical protein